MLSSPITLTHDAASVEVDRINQDGYSAEYFGKTAGGDAITMTVKHTIPARGADGESHLIRLDKDILDATGEYARTVSVWCVMKTTGDVQDDAEVQLLLDTLVAIIPTVDSDVIGRQS